MTPIGKKHLQHLDTRWQQTPSYITLTFTNSDAPPMKQIESSSSSSSLIRHFCCCSLSQDVCVCVCSLFTSIFLLRINRLFSRIHLTACTSKLNLLWGSIICREKSKKRFFEAKKKRNTHTHIQTWRRKRAFILRSNHGSSWYAGKWKGGRDGRFKGLLGPFSPLFHLK